MEYPIFYLAHPYSQYTDKEQPWEYAREWTEKLRNMGYFVFSPILHTHCYDTNRKMDFKEDYLDWDLKIIEGFMKREGFTQFKCVKCGGIRDYTFNCCGKITQKQFYDSGVIVLLSNTAFRRKDYIKVQISTDPVKMVAMEDKVEWLSQGCRQEYEFAKSHHIRVLELESFLEGKEVDL